ncbi:MAG: ABC transporter permease [Terracidiphilus sp.]|jgi:putative ABC transport system permease protein
MNPAIQTEPAPLAEQARHTEQARQRAFQQTLLSARRTMMFSETLKLAMDSFRASKMRFALTALGMVIGTASVILVITIGLTGQEFVLQELQKIETNAIEVEYSGGSATDAERVLYSDSLTQDDEKAVRAQLPGVLYSSPVVGMRTRISFGGGISKDTLVLGVSPQYQQIRNLLVPDGRFFDEEDDSAHIKCAVVSEPFAKERFGSDDAAVGQTFEIERIPFTIIGVFKEAVPDFGNSEIEDHTVLIPYEVARLFAGTENVKQIYFSMRNMNEVNDASKEIIRIIRSRHRADSIFKATTLEEYLSVASSIMKALTLLLVAVSFVTLAVGGVGIMNIMLAGVRARVREIGIRKALGATRREIKLQFLAEAVIISLTGGLVGTAVGLALPISVRLFTDFAIPITPWSVVIALGSAMVVGVIFGTVPATRAAQMDPVEALKYE